MPSRSTLRSPARVNLVVPRMQTATAQYKSFATVGPSSCNKLPQSLRDPFPISSAQLHNHLKTSLFVSVKTLNRDGSNSDLSSAIEMFNYDYEFAANLYITIL